MSARTITAVFVGVLIGAVVTSLGLVTLICAHPAAASTKLEEEVAALRAEVERLKKIVPDQSHPMKDVDYHFTSLWLAAKAGNRALADFYWKETLSHLQWAVRIIPVRKDSAGRHFNVQGILEGYENSPLL